MFKLIFNYKVCCNFSIKQVIFLRRFLNLIIYRYCCLKMCWGASRCNRKCALKKLLFYIFQWVKLKPLYKQTRLNRISNENAKEKMVASKDFQKTCKTFKWQILFSLEAKKVQLQLFKFFLRTMNTLGQIIADRIRWLGGRLKFGKTTSSHVNKTQ